MSNLIDLDGLDLGSLDEKGKPVETRLKDVKAAVGIFAFISYNWSTISTLF